MNVTNAMIERVKALAEELSWDYEKVCIRVQDVPFDMGPMDHRSHVWIDNEETEEELDGVCVLDSAYADLAKHYCGDHVAIIAGNEYSYGQDVGEISLQDAVVVEILA